MLLSFIIEEEGDILIKSGQTVNFKDPLIQKTKAHELKIPLSSILNVSPSSIFKSLKKFVGEEIKKGELIAENKGLLSAKKYFSESDGIIKEINHHEGTVILEVSSDQKDTTLTFFKGYVTNIKDKEITIEVQKYKEFELKKASGDFGGEIIYKDEKALSEVTEEKIKDKIIIVDKIPAFMQVKLEALGAKGFVFLYPYDEEISLPAAFIKQIQEAEKIKSSPYPYCIISKNHNKIYIYT
ncbi:MAG: hypothetical protein HYW86_04090 [Candidatus Roizmanbacteria bacterium]|nr:MAG: hypothetical protein HYW86_04090 [Candidatus Roizmanbacteria bacterium]